MTRKVWIAAWVLSVGATSLAKASGGFYSEAQAARGKAVFQNVCTTCHVLDRTVEPPVGLAGPKFLPQWRSVNDLFSKVSLTMPASHVLSLTHPQYLDVVAFLLESNGLQPGPNDLPADRARLRELALPSAAAPDNISTTGPDAAELSAARPAAATRGPTATAGSLGYYSTRQAARGQQYFQGSCSLCHTTDANARSVSIGDLPQASRIVAAAAPQGLQAGSARVKIRLVGDAFFNQWDSVGALFTKARASMPAYDVGGLNRETYLDIVAYLLSVNGMPAGDLDLPSDIDALLAMPLEHEGFRKLFNGRDFTGFQFLLGHNCTPAPEGCGSTSPGDTFSVRHGTLHSTGSPLGFMYTNGQYLNFTLRLEYRYDPQPEAVGEPTFYGNSGWLLFLRDLKVWPRTLEIQGLEPHVLDVIPIDAKATFRVDADARARALRPLEWNRVEIQSRHGQVRCSLNGTLVSVVTAHDFKQPGYIGFQSEGGGVSFRNILIRPE